MKKPIYIYALIDPRTAEVRYIGLTRFPEKRLSNEIHYPHNNHLRNWVNSLKEDGVRPEMTILQVCKKDADEHERKWIAFHRSLGCKLLNYTDGGETGFKFSKESIEKLRVLSSSRRYGPMSEEHKAKISAALKGRLLNPNSSEQFRKLNISRRGIPLSEEHKAKVSAGVSAAMTPEVRKKLSDAGKGKKPYEHTEETRRNVAEGMKRWHAENRETFLANMRARGATCPQDPTTGRFIKKATG